MQWPVEKRRRLEGQELSESRPLSLGIVSNSCGVARLAEEGNECIGTATGDGQHQQSEARKERKEEGQKEGEDTCEDSQRLTAVEEQMNPLSSSRIVRWTTQELLERLRGLGFPAGQVNGLDRRALEKLAFEVRLDDTLRSFIPCPQSLTISCRYFSEGRCRKGAACWFRHEQESSTLSTPATASALEANRDDQSGAAGECHTLEPIEAEDQNSVAQSTPRDIADSGEQEILQPRDMNLKELRLRLHAEGAPSHDLSPERTREELQKSLEKHLLAKRKATLMKTVHTLEYQQKIWKPSGSVALPASIRFPPRSSSRPPTESLPDKSSREHVSLSVASTPCLPEPACPPRPSPRQPSCPPPAHLLMGKTETAETWKDQERREGLKDWEYLKAAWKSATVTSLAAASEHTEALSRQQGVRATWEKQNGLTKQAETEAQQLQAELKQARDSYAEVSSVWFSPEEQRCAAEKVDFWFLRVTGMTQKVSELTQLRDSLASDLECAEEKLAAAKGVVDSEQKNLRDVAEAVRAFAQHMNNLGCALPECDDDDWASL